jgi:hypothetical protein
MSSYYLVVKPELNATGLHAVRDKGGNTWYALKNRKVLCEKTDGTWLTYDMPDSSDIDPYTDTTNVDSAFRIRLLDKLDGTQEKLLIACRGVVHVGADFSVVATRRASQSYNNYFIRDALIDSQGTYWVTSEMGLEKGTSLVVTTYVKDLYPTDQSPNAPGTGIVALAPLTGDMNRNGLIDLADFILVARSLVGKTSPELSAFNDIDGDLKIGEAELIFILQRLSGLR